MSPEVVVPNLRQSPSSWIWIRMQVKDNGFRWPAQMRLKAWQAGANEPNWQLTQEFLPNGWDGGDVMLRTYVNPTTQGPIVFHFDSIRVLTGVNW